MTSSGWTRQHRCEYRQTTVQEPWGATEGCSRTSTNCVAEVNELRGEVGTLRERMAHLEGLMEGLREAIVGRARAS